MVVVISDGEKLFNDSLKVLYGETGGRN